MATKKFSDAEFAGVAYAMLLVIALNSNERGLKATVNDVLEAAPEAAKEHGSKWFTELLASGALI